jgi:hypothetical protein
VSAAWIAIGTHTTAVAAIKNTGTLITHLPILMPDSILSIRQDEAMTMINVWINAGDSWDVGIANLTDRDW